MAVLPFRMYNTDECASIVQGLGNAVGIWNRQWFSALDYGLEFRNVEGKSDETAARIRRGVDRSSTVFGSFSSDCLALTVDGDIAAKHMVGLLSEEVGDGAALSAALPAKSDFDELLERQLVADCLGDMTAQVCGVTASQQRPLTEMAAFEARLIRGCGSGVLTITYNDFYIELILGPELVSRYVPPIQVRKIGKLTPLLGTIVDRPVQLRAELGTTLVTIGDLDRLAVGDVVKLDQSIEIAPKLVTLSGDKVVNGRLGSMGGRKALQVY
jgi:hypothetical protein